MMDTTLDPTLVKQSLNFHGQQLQRTWEGERGDDDLAKINVGPLDFAVYQSRQLAFTDRGKRLKLHQFIAKEAAMLFDSTLLEEAPSSSTLGTDNVVPEDNLYALMPPFETFLNIDKSARLRHFFDNVKPGDLVIAAVLSRQASGILLKILCTAGPNPRHVADINVKAFLPVTNIIPAVDKKNVSRNYLLNDNVCCEVIEVIPDTDKMVCGMKGVTRGPDDPPPSPPLGLLSTDDFPLAYKKACDMKGESYESILEKSPGFNNPNCVQYLSELLGVANMHCTNFSTLRGGFAPQEYADELRQAQASKWAFRSVAEGIEHFKAGRHSEAFQCLNKALSIDPRNVEGLVARGALYANSGTFKKAIEDFETSLKLNPSHANARKYMGETLVALGRSYEDENKIAEAQKAYEDCLAIIPFHDEAKNSLEFLKSKGATVKPLIEPAELLLPGLTGAKSYEMKETLKQLLNLTEKKDKKKKKKRGKGKKKRSSSSSSSSSDSSSSSESSDSSSSSSDSSDSEGPQRKKKRRSRSHNKRQRSLSPLSKRMAMIGEGDASGRSHNSQFNHPYGYQPAPVPMQPPIMDEHPIRSQADVEYENKVRKFLEMTKEDSDYEDKVRKFLEETAQYKRNRKMQELGAATAQPIDHDKGKKRKKKDKKTKKESKRKRKERERKAKAARSSNAADFDTSNDKKLRDALRKELKNEDRKKSKRDMSSDNEYDRKNQSDKRLLDEMPDLEELESKLSAYYAKVEKDTSLGSKRRDSRSQSVEKPPPPLDKPKWKMQMNAIKDKVKKKENNSKPGHKEKYAFDDSSDESAEVEKSRKVAHPPSPLATDKNVSVRRAMALKEPPPLPPLPPPQKREPEPPGTEDAPQPTVPRPKQNVVLDKFGSFRLVQEGETTVSADGGKVEQFTSRSKPRRPRSPSRSKSGSSSPDNRSSAKRSRSRERPRKYRSRSGSRSQSASSASDSGVSPRRRRSNSARSRSRSEASRSYYSRSRSRSRSGSRDRYDNGYRRFQRRGQWRGRGGYERGTYYRPRFQTYNNGGRGGRGGWNNDFRRDDRRFYNNDWRDNRSRGNRPFRPRRGNNRGRPFRGGFRDFRDRRGGPGRYSRSRSPDRRQRSRSYSPEARRHDMKDRDSYSERDGHRSEGEYEEERFVDRKEYDGKWAENNDAPERTEKPSSPAEKE